jgi:hypothetical protein
MKTNKLNGWGSFGTVALAGAVLVWSCSARAALRDYQTAITNEPSLISYYTFDQTNANDNFGSHNGTLQFVTDFSPGVDGAGQGLLLRGIGFVELGHVSAFDFAGGAGSVEAWVRADWSGTLSTYNPCMFADRDGGLATWSVHMNGDKSAVAVWNGSKFMPFTISPASTNWHHLAVVFDKSSGAGQTTIYWDGASLGSTNQDLGTNPEPTQLGSSEASVIDEGWIGMLDEVAFYGAALGADAVRGHYQAMVGPASGSAPTLSFSRSGNQIIISWPVDVTGFALQSTDKLPATSWITLDFAGPGNQVTVDPVNAARFFRLVK